MAPGTGPAWGGAGSLVVVLGGRMSGAERGELNASMLSHVVAATSGMTQCVFVTDRDMRIIAWSPQCEKCLGLTREAAIGRLCYEILRGRDVHGNPGRL